MQAVGRVMRHSPGKEKGYVIIPLVINSKKSPEESLAISEEFGTIWQVLSALRSIDQDLVLVDGALEKLDSNIEVISANNNLITSKYPNLPLQKSTLTETTSSDKKITNFKLKMNIFVSKKV